MNNITETHACIYCGDETSVEDFQCTECYSKELVRVMHTEEYAQQMDAWFEEQMLNALCAEYDSRSYDEPVHYELA